MGQRNWSRRPLGRSHGTQSSLSLSVCAVMMTVSGAKETKVSAHPAVCRELLLVWGHRREWWESGRGQYLVRTMPSGVALIQTRDPELSSICWFLHRHHPRISNCFTESQDDIFRGETQRQHTCFGWSSARSGRCHSQTFSPHSCKALSEEKFRHLEFAIAAVSLPAKAGRGSCCIPSISTKWKSLAR